MKLLYFIISIFTIVNLSFAQCDYDIGDIDIILYFEIGEKIRVTAMLENIMKVIIEYSISLW